MLSEREHFHGHWKRIRFGVLAELSLFFYVIVNVIVGGPEISEEPTDPIEADEVAFAIILGFLPLVVLIIIIIAWVKLLSKNYYGLYYYAIAVVLAIISDLGTYVIFDQVSEWYQIIIGYGISAFILVNGLLLRQARINRRYSNI